MALDTQGKIYVWGRNDHGQLGLGKEMRDKNLDIKSGQQSSEKKMVERLVQETPLPIEGTFKDDKFCQIYAGNYQSFAVTVDGEIYAWGDNTYGQLLMREGSEEQKNDNPDDTQRVRNIFYEPTKFNLDQFGIVVH